MKKIFAVMLVVTLLTSLFSFNLVEAKSKTLTLTGEIIKVGMEKTDKISGALALKCEDKTYSLTGFTIGMKNFINYTAKVTGTTSTNSKGDLVLKVKSYKIIGKSEPSPDRTPKIDVTPTTMESISPVKTTEGIQNPTPELSVTQPPKTNKLEGTLFINESNPS